MLIVPPSGAIGIAVESAVFQVFTPLVKMGDVQALHRSHFLLRLMVIDMNLPSMFVNEAVGRVTIILENVPHYGEWIKGEAGDITLYRATDDHRIVGAFLPFKVPVTPK